MSAEKASFGILIVSRRNGHHILSCAGPLSLYASKLLGHAITDVLIDFTPGTINYMRDDRILERSFFTRLPGHAVVELAGCIAVEPDGTEASPTYTIVLDLTDMQAAEPADLQHAVGLGQRPPIPGFF